MRMVTDNVNLVHHVIRKYFSWCAKEYDDLYQVGCIGLIKASARFKPELGFQFSTYASRFIYGAIKQYLRNNNEMHFVRNDVEDMRKVKYAKHKTDDIEEICKITELSKSRVEEVLQMILGTLSIHSVAPNTKNATLEEMLSDGYDFTSDVLRNDELERMMEILNSNERTAIIDMYFNNMTQLQIAHKLNCSQVTVSRLLTSAIKKMRTGKSKQSARGKAIKRIDKYCTETVFVNATTANKITGVSRDTIAKACRFDYTTRDGDRWMYV